MSSQQSTSLADEIEASVSDPNACLVDAIDCAYAEKALDMKGESLAAQIEFLRECGWNREDICWYAAGRHKEGPE